MIKREEKKGNSIVHQMKDKVAYSFHSKKEEIESINIETSPPLDP